MKNSATRAKAGVPGAEPLAVREHRLHPVREGEAAGVAVTLGRPLPRRETHVLGGAPHGRAVHPLLGCEHALDASERDHVGDRGERGLELGLAQVLDERLGQRLRGPDA
ncbi:MAG TPA: hypothetical protein RMH99_06125 [Sandaracinaceae bacterium LLY-WYZ-13_1]|nr:hypothetical protein [Sandaracinaceae bacterium LLY-WYZ-13_1]